MQRGTPQHVIGRRLTDLCAILQERLVFEGRVCAAKHETVSGRFDADGVTLLTVIDAFAHGDVDFVRHGSLGLS